MAGSKNCHHGGHEGYSQMGGMHGILGMHGHKQGKKMMRHMARSLDLTDVQEDAIKDLMQAQYEGMSEGHQAIKQQLEQLGQLESGSDAYIAKAKEIGALQGEAMGQRLIERDNFEVQIMALLTPIQVEQYQEMRNKMTDH